MNLPILSHFGNSLDHDKSSWQVNAVLPIKLWLAAQSMVIIVPGDEAAQFPCVDTSTAKAGHSTGPEGKK